jgi:L-2-hydroxyglutarate oxidase LhgO
MTDEVDVVVIGAGVIGLAVARELALAGRDVVVLEAADRIGSVTSARNSEVIHGGIYYTPGSLKARFCVEGRRRLYEYAKVRSIPVRQIGKLIVATNCAHVESLEALVSNGEANGVDDLLVIDGRAVRELEPEVNCVAAVLSPSSGIVDTHALMTSYLGDIEDAGGRIALNTRVVGAAKSETGLTIEVGDYVNYRVTASTVINCAGLEAIDVARSIVDVDEDILPQQHFAKGNYFALGRAGSPFNRLIYPIPEPGGLGIHATIDMAGRVKFGPDVEWTEHLDYSVNPARETLFSTAIRQYWPTLPDKALVPDYCGIRPKLSGPCDTAVDFQIWGPERHGVAGLWNLFGIESPGLTASLAIGEYVHRQVVSYS